MERKQGAYGFEIKDQGNHIVKTDTSPENGGANYGFRPMQLLLAALGSCSGIDLISILSKQKLELDDLKISIEGEREKDIIPSLWKEISVVFYLYGSIDEMKAQRAAALSMEKYCSVAETLRRGGTTINWTVKLNEEAR